VSPASPALRRGLLAIHNAIITVAVSGSNTSTVMDLVNNDGRGVERGMSTDELHGCEHLSLQDIDSLSGTSRVEYLSHVRADRCKAHENINDEGYHRGERAMRRCIPQGLRDSVLMRITGLVLGVFMQTWPRRPFLWWGIPPTRWNPSSTPRTQRRRTMKRVCKLTLSTLGLLFLGVALAAGEVYAQTIKDLAGTWTLVSNVIEQGGNKTDSFGPHPKGILTVDANGRYVLAIARADLPKVASNNRRTATPEENKAIVQGSITHFDTLSVNAADKTITFKIETYTTFPNSDGTEEKRPFTLTGDELKLTFPAASGGGTVTAVWKRAK
jgi:Lipocalin-like domain